jgi:phosphoglycerate dehydrogenase-like enzyme
MSAETSRPRVALHADVVGRLTPAVRDAVDVVAFEAAADLADLDVDGVRFLAPGPQGHAAADLMGRFCDLEVLQVASAGTDWIESELPPTVTLCSARGARDAPVAEWILGALLGTSSQLLPRAGARKWDNLWLQDLADWTVLIVGMGSIGAKVQSYLEPIGARTVGVASHARDDLHGIDELAELLPEADAVVLLTPLTAETEKLISTSELEAMKDGAVLINAARGGVVDTDAMVTELQRGRIQAILDVTEPEPLPAGHPLWSAPGLLSITPHLAGASAAGNRGAAQLAADQLGRWLRGEKLENVVAGPGS